MSFNNTSDEYWAEKLRRENCDQFNTLVRMHLSFVLDLNTDDNEGVTEKTKFKKWSFVPFVKKTKCPSRGVMDGAPLTQEGICQVYQLIEYLGKEPNICSEGIFRRTGSLARQQELRSLLNQGQPLNLDGGRYSVHDCASVLKGFLAELPEPLLTDAHYPAHCQLADLCCGGSTPQPPAAETRLLRSLQLLLLLLPTENRVLLRDVLQLLNETAKREPSNKMSADSLATLFTPHLLCPRRLSPEALHTDSQTLSGIVAFMIRRGISLFEIPPKLAVDIRSYFTSSSSERSPAANTVYSFLDRERTARAHATDPTETALAQLYAYIQGLPESSKKRKLVKQFNRQNGNGTPLQQAHGGALRSKSLGDSIKRHIFFHKTMKRTDNQVTRMRSSSEEVLSSPNCVPLGTARTKLFCVDCESSSSDSEAVADQVDSKSSNPVKEDNVDEDVATAAAAAVDSDADDEQQQQEEDVDDDVSEHAVSADEYEELQEPQRRTTRCFSEPDLSSESGADRCWTATCLTSTPAVLPLTRQLGRDVTFTPLSHNGRKSMSPITRSTQKMSRAMQESMMTPRSRKPVLLMSGTNMCGIPKLELLKRSNSTSSLLEEERTDEESSLSRTRSVLSTEDPIDASFSSRTDDYGYSCNLMDGSSMFQENDENNPPATPLDNDREHSRKRSASPDSSCEMPVAKKISLNKEPVLKPKQYNSDGEPVVYETSF